MIAVAMINFILGGCILRISLFGGVPPVRAIKSHNLRVHLVFFTTPSMFNNLTEIVYFHSTTIA